MRKLILCFCMGILLLNGCSKETTSKEMTEGQVVTNEVSQNASTCSETIQDVMVVNDIKQEKKSEEKKSEEKKSEEKKSEEKLVLLSSGNMDNEQIEKPFYRMEFTYDPEAQTISGTETVTFMNTSNSEWDNVCFRDFPSDKSFQKSKNAGITNINNISIKYPSGKTKGSILTRDKKNNTILYFSLAEPMKPKDMITISFDVCIHVPERNDRFGYNEIGCNLGYFFPILSMYVDGKWENHPYYELGECTYTECSTFDVTVTAPEGYMVITTGDLAARNGNVTQFYADNVRDFTMVISNNYRVISQDYKGVTINSYYVEGDEEGGKIVLQAAADAIDVYSETIGEYPYKSLDALEVNLSAGAGGMEYPQLIMLDRKSYQSIESLKLVTAHETAHQWFYGIIGNDSYDEAWLDEGFATYLEIVYYEKVNPQMAERRLKSYKSKEVYSSKKSNFGLKDINSRVSDFSTDFSYVITVYNRAGEFLVTLRNVMGEEDFNSALQDIYENYKFKITDTKAVLDIFQNATEEDLSDLFDYYIDEDKYSKLL